MVGQHPDRADYRACLTFPFVRFECDPGADGGHGIGNGHREIVGSSRIQECPRRPVDIEPQEILLAVSIEIHDYRCLAKVWIFQSEGWGMAKDRHARLGRLQRGVSRKFEKLVDWPLDIVLRYQQIQLAIKVEILEYSAPGESFARQAVGLSDIGEVEGAIIS